MEENKNLNPTDTENAVDNQNEVQEETHDTPSIEDLLAKLAEKDKLLAEKDAAYKKLKVANDKTSKSEAELKRQIAARLSAEEQAEIAQKEENDAKNAEFERLQAFERKTLAKDRYILQGMTPEMASEAAEAEVSGDMDKLAEIQKKHTETVLKSAEAEWKESIPQLQVGTGEYASMTKEEILAIKDDNERQKAIAQNLHLFK